MWDAGFWKWGGWPAVEAMGTLLAFFVTYRLLRKERLELREAREVQRRDQAARVSAWFEEWGAPVYEADPDGKFHRWVELRVRNNSEEPITNVDLTLAREGVILGADERAYWSQHWTDLRPSPHPLKLSRPIEVPHGLAADPDPDVPVLSLWFVDARGNPWRRVSSRGFVLEDGDRFRGATGWRRWLAMRRYRARLRLAGWWRRLGRR